MKKIIYSIIFLSLMPVALLGNDPKFDEKLTQIHSDLIATNAKEAIHLADSLVRIAGTDQEKIMSRMMVSLVHKSTGNYGLAIKYAKEAENIVDLVGLLELESKCAVLLATIYRDIGIYSTANEYMEKALENIPFIKNEMNRKKIFIIIKQEMAISNILTKDFSKAIELIKDLSPRGIDHKNGTTLSLCARNSLIYGFAMEGAGKPKEAIPHLLEAVHHAKGEKSLTLAQAFLSLAKSHYLLNQLDSTKIYLNKVQPFLNGGRNFRLMVEYLRFNATFQSSIGNSQGANLSLFQLEKLNEQHIRTAEVIGNEVITQMEKDLRKVRTDNIILAWLIALSVIIYFLFYFLKIRPIQRYAKQLISSNQQFDTRFSHDPPDRELNGSVGGQEFQISVETETRLVKKLNQLEQEKFFLEKNITLNALTNTLMTNQKYLSFIIKKYKNQGFSDYIANLRIAYIVDVLRNDTQVLDYKLSYIADMARFSSHSMFTLAFKSNMGMTPSQFIENLKKEGQN